MRNAVLIHFDPEPTRGSPAGMWAGLLWSTDHNRQKRFEDPLDALLCAISYATCARATRRSSTSNRPRKAVNRRGIARFAESLSTFPVNCDKDGLRRAISLNQNSDVVHCRPGLE